MASKTMLVGRWLAVPLVGVHLLLAGAAVPHCPDQAAAAGSANVPAHHHAHRKPHRHWAWCGHCRAHDRHDDGADGLPLGPGDHDGDATYLVNAIIAGAGEQFELASRGAVRWAELPPQPPRGPAAETRRHGRWVKPPGERLPTVHDLLPHVLRV
jgi:hypothetical protein